MIRPLRQRHRRVVTALAVVLPLAFVVAILVRRTVPIFGAPIFKSASFSMTNHTGLDSGTPR